MERPDEAITYLEQEISRRSKTDKRIADILLTYIADLETDLNALKLVSASALDKYITKVEELEAKQITPKLEAAVALVELVLDEFSESIINYGSADLWEARRAYQAAKALEEVSGDDY